MTDTAANSNPRAVRAWLFFEETFGPLALAGMGLVVLGVVLVNLAQRQG